MVQFAGETQSCEGFETLIRLTGDVDGSSPRPPRIGHGRVTM